MLIIRRKKNERIDIEHNGAVLATIIVTKITEGNVFLGFDLPDDYIISRDNAKSKKRSKNANAQAETGQGQ